MIIVKFFTVGDPSKQVKKIGELLGDDFVTARQLFPDDSEEELATLFEVELRASSSVEQAVTSLEKDPDIEYSHKPSPRNAI